MPFGTNWLRSASDSSRSRSLFELERTCSNSSALQSVSLTLTLCGADKGRRQVEKW